MIETVTSLLFGGEGAVVYECRRCGTTVDATATACPNCGDDDIVTHTTR
ncbi:hypothetical protein [Halovivax limisalsi]|nr:hypothetical protein [Halovivax limisalsi]